MAATKSFRENGSVSARASEEQETQSGRGKYLERNPLGKERAMNQIENVEEKYLKKDIEDFNVGDNVKVHVVIREGEKERIQIFRGDVITKRGSGLGSTFTVRKISFGIGVERIFPLHSQMIKKIEVVRKGKVRRAKLYYLRALKGKAARIKEKRT